MRGGDGEEGGWGGDGVEAGAGSFVRGVDGGREGVTNCVCSSIKRCTPVASLCSEVDSRNAIVGTGLDVSVEKRFILSVAFGSWRDELVSMRNGWVVGRCCWAA